MMLQKLKLKLAYWSSLKASIRMFSCTIRSSHQEYSISHIGLLSTEKMQVGATTHMATFLNTNV